MNNKIEYVGFSLSNIVYESLPQRLVVHGHDLINDKQFRILSLAIFKHSIVIVFDDPDLHDKSVTESYMVKRKGNIYCYTIGEKAELLWHIDDLISEQLHLPFCSGRIAFDKDKSFYAKWYGINFINDHEYYIALNYGGENYIIDITSGKLVKIVYMKN